MNREELRAVRSEMWLGIYEMWGLEHPSFIAKISPVHLPPLRLLLNIIPGKGSCFGKGLP